MTNPAKVRKLTTLLTGAIQKADEPFTHGEILYALKSLHAVISEMANEQHAVLRQSVHGGKPEGEKQHG